MSFFYLGVVVFLKLFALEIPLIASRVMIHLETILVFDESSLFIIQVIMLALFNALLDSFTLMPDLQTCLMIPTRYHVVTLVNVSLVSISSF